MEELPGASLGLDRPVVVGDLVLVMAPSHGLVPEYELSYLLANGGFLLLPVVAPDFARGHAVAYDVAGKERVVVLAEEGPESGDLACCSAIEHLSAVE